MARARTTICWEGWACLILMGIILAGAELRELNALMIIFGMIAATMLFNHWAVRAMLTGISGRRRLPRRVRAGDVLAAEVEIRSTRRGGAWSIVAEDAFRSESDPSIRPAKARCFFPYVRSQNARTATYQGRLFCRGWYRVGPLKVSSRFPLGLVRRTTTIAPADRILVLPRLGRMTGRWARLYQEATPGAHETQRQQGRAEGDFHGLRDWRPGDSHRWVHWRTSARHDQLIVRQFEQPRNEDLVVLVDLWQSENPTVDELDRVELAVSFAATIVADVCRRGGSLLVVGVAGSSQRLTPGKASPAFAEELFDQLAEAAAAPHREQAILVASARKLVRGSATAIFITTRPESIAGSGPSPVAAWQGRSYSFNVCQKEWSEYFVPDELQNGEPYADVSEEISA